MRPTSEPQAKRESLYRHLLFLDGGAVEISPAPLNKGESLFVKHLMAYHKANSARFADQELYLLRKRPRP